MAQRGSNSFKEEWLPNNRFKDWIVKEASTSVICRWCKTVLHIKNMGVGTLTSHSKYRKHQNVQNHFAEGKQGPLQQFLTPVSTLNAKIKWCLKVVMSNFSFRSCSDINKLFRDMFPDSNIAKQFQLGKTKCAYFINYGIAPHFKLFLVRSMHHHFTAFPLMNPLTVFFKVNKWICK